MREVRESLECLFWHSACRSRLGSEEEDLAALLGSCCVEISNGDATQAGALSKGETLSRCATERPKTSSSRAGMDMGPKNTSVQREAGGS